MHKDRQDILQPLIEKLIRTAHSMHSGQSFPFGNLMLSRQQIMALFFIYDNNNSIPVNSIAKFLRVTPGAVTQLVDTLVEKKLVKREESKIDRRIINIQLTPAVEKKFALFKKRYLVNASYLFEDLSNQDIKKLIDLLDKVKPSLLK